MIQGSAAIQTKIALVELDKANYFLQLQVHDETDGSYGSDKEAQSAGKIMKEWHLRLSQTTSSISC